MPRAACAKLRALVRDRLSACDARRIFLWVDQACKGRREESKFDWLAEGLMPYSQLPVLKVCGNSALDDVEGRLWPKIELTLGLNRVGVRWADVSGKVHSLCSVGDHAAHPDSSVAAACRLVLCGYADDLRSFWEEDFRRLQTWSVRILLQDRGPRCIAEYQRSNSIQYAGSMHLCKTDVEKLLLGTITMDQMMPLGCAASFRVTRLHWAAWTAALPPVEIDEVRRSDRVFYCSEKTGIAQSHRYFAVCFADGNVQYVIVAQSRTPNGELLLLQLEGDEVKITKINFPVLDDQWSNLALLIETMKMDGANDMQCVDFCRSQMKIADRMTASKLQHARYLLVIQIQGIEHKTNEQLMSLMRCRAANSDS